MAWHCTSTAAATCSAGRASVARPLAIPTRTCLRASLRDGLAIQLSPRSGERRGSDRVGIRLMLPPRTVPDENLGHMPQGRGASVVQAISGRGGRKAGKIALGGATACRTQPLAGSVRRGKCRWNASAAVAACSVCRALQTPRRGSLFAFAGEASAPSAATITAEMDDSEKSELGVRSRSLLGDCESMWLGGRCSPELVPSDTVSRAVLIGPDPRSRRRHGAPSPRSPQACWPPRRPPGRRCAHRQAPSGCAPRWRAAGRRPLWCGLRSRR